MGYRAGVLTILSECHRCLLWGDASALFVCRHGSGHRKSPPTHSLGELLPAVHQVLVEAQSLCAMALAFHLVFSGSRRGSPPHALGLLPQTRVQLRRGLADRASTQQKGLAGLDWFQNPTVNKGLGAGLATIALAGVGAGIGIVFGTMLLIGFVVSRGLNRDEAHALPGARTGRPGHQR